VLALSPSTIPRGIAWRGACNIGVVSSLVEPLPHGSWTSRHWKAAIVGLLVAALAFAIAIWAGETARERRALLRMDSSDRRALYEDTLRSTETVCARAVADHALQARCESSARFLLAFPECDEGCHAVARGHLAGPTR
jgi:hypothetical protein